MSFTWHFVGRLVPRYTSPRNMFKHVYCDTSQLHFTFNTYSIRHGCTVDSLRTPSTSAPETGNPHLAYNATLATADYTVRRQLWSLTLKAYTARARSLAFFIPRAKEDFGIYRIINAIDTKRPTNDISKHLLDSCCWFLLYQSQTCGTSHTHRTTIILYYIQCTKCTTCFKCNLHV